ncbi:hypothetical protein E1A91_D12G240300v1 [Gossypium mustelinum]|uniref:Uncharacterized protein n=1 Tax=Gossypium mustelinum TaxID=34275 RepID=A0A5D2SKC8_GOSMU|nr:hypothetical protein E1A91_D12G240300v1 [Gossypium mustelinum]
MAQILQPNYIETQNDKQFSETPRVSRISQLPLQRLFGSPRNTRSSTPRSSRPYLQQTTNNKQPKGQNKKTTKEQQIYSELKFVTKGKKRGKEEREESKIYFSSFVIFIFGYIKPFFRICKKKKEKRKTIQRYKNFKNSKYSILLRIKGERKGTYRESVVFLSAQMAVHGGAMAKERRIRAGERVAETPMEAEAVFLI